MAGGQPLVYPHIIRSLAVGHPAVTLLQGGSSQAFFSQRWFCLSRAILGLGVGAEGMETGVGTHTPAANFPTLAPTRLDVQTSPVTCPHVGRSGDSGEGVSHHLGL